MLSHTTSCTPAPREQACSHWEGPAPPTRPFSWAEFLHTAPWMKMIKWWSLPNTLCPAVLWHYESKVILRCLLLLIAQIRPGMALNIPQDLVAKELAPLFWYKMGPLAP